MDKVILNAQKRTVVGRKVKKIRREGSIPANLYGKKIKSVALLVAEKDFTGVFSRVGETGLVGLLIDKESHPVLIHNVAYHPVTNAPLHIDFFQVDLKEKVVTRMPLAFTGESPAVKDKLGVLLHILSEVEIEALPTDIPEKIEVDISVLAAVGDSLKVSDIKLTDKVKILSDLNLEIVKVAPLVSKEAEKLAKEEAEAKAAAAVQAETAAPTEGKTAEASTSASPASSPSPEAKKE